MKILLNFKNENNSWISAAIIYIHTNNEEIEITEDKNEDYHFSVENFESLEGLLVAMKLDFPPYIDYVAINKLLADRLQYEEYDKVYAKELEQGYVLLFFQDFKLTKDSKELSEKKVNVKHVRLIDSELFYCSEFGVEQFHKITHKGIEYFVTMNCNWSHSGYSSFLIKKNNFFLIIYEKDALENLLNESKKEYSSLFYSTKIHKGNLLPKNNYEEIIKDLKLDFNFSEYVKVKNR